MKQLQVESSQASSSSHNYPSGVIYYSKRNMEEQKSRSNYNPKNTVPKVIDLTHENVLQVFPSEMDEFGNSKSSNSFAKT